MMPVGKAGVVLDVGGEHELAAGADAFDHERVQVGARGVDRGGEAGRARSDDDDFAAFPWSSSARRSGSGLALAQGLRLVQQNHPATRKIPPSMHHAAQTSPCRR